MQKNTSTMIMLTDEINRSILSGFFRGSALLSPEHRSSNGDKTSLEDKMVEETEHLRAYVARFKKKENHSPMQTTERLRSANSHWLYCEKRITIERLLAERAGNGAGIERTIAGNF